MAADYSSSSYELAKEHLEICYEHVEKTLYLNDKESHLYCKLKESEEDHPIYIKMRSNPVYENLVSFALAHGLSELLT